MVQKSLKLIAWKGRIIIVGFAAGSIEKIPMNLVLLKNIAIVGLHWGMYYSEFIRLQAPRSQVTHYIKI